MALWEGSREPVRILYRRLMLLGLFLLVVGVGWGVWRIYWREVASAELNQEAQAQFQSLQTQQSQLAGDITTLQSERGEEAALRQQYAVGKPGEGEVMIVEPASATPTQATTTILDQIGDFFSNW